MNNAINLKIYGPEWYNSYNTEAPWGGNDGALWQGRGYNTSITTGARLEAYGFELTLKPNFFNSQNSSFDKTILSLSFALTRFNKFLIVLENNIFFALEYIVSESSFVKLGFFNLAPLELSVIFLPNAVKQFDNVKNFVYFSSFS